jgi:hypothetical protein
MSLVNNSNNFVVTIMKAIKALRAKFKVDSLWESPPLHILFTREDQVIVARCLDFTVASHGHGEKDALNSLTEAVKEYILTALENDVINSIYDPAHGRYWRMFNELEARQTNTQLKRTLKKSVSVILENKSASTSVEISRA